jgi:hypothetical protein
MSLVALPVRGCGIREKGHQTLHGVTNPTRSGSSQESCTIEGNSPVHETPWTPLDLPSSAGSGKAGVNLRGPPRKAKYSQATDSELVP